MKAGKLMVLRLKTVRVVLLNFEGSLIKLMKLQATDIKQVGRR